jgi:hypothetical protein
MAEVYRYLKEPAKYPNLSEREIPTDEEMDPFKPVIAKDQLFMYMKLMEMARAEGEDE